MSNNECFEDLPALAVLGRLRESEAAQLDSHLRECSSCRSVHANFAGINPTEAPAVSDGAGVVRSMRMSAGGSGSLRQRFLERARAEGVRFSPEIDSMPVKVQAPRFPSILLRPAVLGLATVLVVLVVGAHELMRARRAARDVDVGWERQFAQVAESNRELRARVAGLGKTQAQVGTEITRLERERAASRAQILSLERTLEGTREEELTLQAELSDAKARAGEFEKGSLERAREASELKKELDKARAAQMENEAALAAQRDRVRELSRELAAQSELSDREGRLLAAGKDVRDLMGARNLHIIDVFDVDGRGVTRRPFGRVFYTERRSLVFYAFDLAAKRTSPPGYSFQAWGCNEATRRTVQNLGIFYSDDKTQNRWVLKFDDPEVLAQIDAVFVTVERPGGSSEPSGRKLLYAYLMGRPNHP